MSRLLLVLCATACLARSPLDQRELEGPALDEQPTTFEQPLPGQLGTGLGRSEVGVQSASSPAAGQAAGKGSDVIPANRWTTADLSKGALRARKAVFLLGVGVLVSGLLAGAAAASIRKTRKLTIRIPGKLACAASPRKSLLVAGAAGLVLGVTAVCERGAAEQEGAHLGVLWPDGVMVAFATLGAALAAGGLAAVVAGFHKTVQVTWREIDLMPWLTGRAPAPAVDAPAAPSYTHALENPTEGLQEAAAFEELVPVPEEDEGNFPDAEAEARADAEARAGIARAQAAFDAGQEAQLLEELRQLRRSPRLCRQPEIRAQLTELERKAFESRQTSWRRRRKLVLMGLLPVYVGICTVVPLVLREEVSCSNGFYWEHHTLFVAFFFVTKVVELTLYVHDASIDGELPFWKFATMFVASFFGLSDGYQDATSIQIAAACGREQARGVDRALASMLSQTMAVSFYGGVVLLQWGVLGCLAMQDSSLAILAKLLHMDALAACLTMSEGNMWLWWLVNFARTFAEDIPQAVQQTLFVLRVKRNLFMVGSIFVSVVCSLKALHDACGRGPESLGFRGWSRLLDDIVDEVEPEGADAEIDAKEVRHMEIAVDEGGEEEASVTTRPSSPQARQLASTPSIRVPRTGSLMRHASSVTASVSTERRPTTPKVDDTPPPPGYDYVAKQDWDTADVRVNYPSLNGHVGIYAYHCQACTCGRPGCNGRTIWSCCLSDERYAMCAKDGPRTVQYRGPLKGSAKHGKEKEAKSEAEDFEWQLTVGGRASTGSGNKRVYHAFSLASSGAT